MSKGNPEFQLSNIISDPFALSSLSFAAFSWIIHIAGSIAAASQSSTGFPKFTWWGIAFEFLTIVALFLFYSYDIIDYYRHLIIAALVICVIYSSNSATNLVYSNGSGFAAASAGCILLAMVFLVWIIYFGGDNESPTNVWIDSFSIKGPRPGNVRRGFQSQYEAPKSQYFPDSHYMASNALNGFENYSVANPNSGVGTAIPGINSPVDHMRAGIPLDINTDTFQGDEFPYTAVALYAYEADPNDAYEISFEQGEKLKVGDIDGRWWRAKKANGEVGICPSNYVKLDEDAEL